MPCLFDDIKAGQQVILELSMGTYCEECGAIIEPSGANVPAIYLEYRDGQHYFSSHERVCAGCGSASNGIVCHCGNSARSLFSEVTVLASEESTEAESLVVIEAPRRSTYGSPKNSVTLWD